MQSLHIKIAIKRDCSPKHFLEVTKGIERLQQNAIDKLRFLDPTQSKSSDRVFFTKIEDHNYVL